MTVLLFAVEIALILALSASAVLFRGIWRDADSIGSVRDWGKAALCCASGLAGLVAVGSWWLPAIAVSVLFAGYSYLVRGLIRFAQGRIHPVLNGLARQLGAVTSLVIMVHLALAVSSQQVNDAFVHAVGGLYFLFAVFACATACQQTQDSSFLRLPLNVLLGAVVALLVASLIGLFDVLSGVPTLTMLTAGIQLVSAFLVAGSLVVTVNRLRQARSASTAALVSDPLTGLQSSAAMAATIRRHFLGPLSKPVVLLTIEVDGFDSLSQTIGEDVSRRLVRQVSRAIRMSCRETDTVSRCSTARFVVACIGADQDEGLEVAERIRRRVKRTEIYQAHGQPVACSVSVGLSSPFSSLALSSHAARQADKALDQAQTLGGNLTISHRPAR
jgi:diguanylate cyclase (GGDEF)-like protein